MAAGVVVGASVGLAWMAGVGIPGVSWLITVGLAKLTFLSGLGLIAAGATLIRIENRREQRALAARGPASRP